MGTTTSSYQRKKRGKQSQKNRRREQTGKIEGLFKPGTEFGNRGSASAK